MEEELKPETQQEVNTQTISSETKKEEPTPEPTVKVCPFCYSEIPYKATKCAHCTSELEIQK